jgi:hypothetical protein
MDFMTAVHGSEWRRLGLNKEEAMCLSRALQTHGFSGVKYVGRGAFGMVLAVTDVEDNEFAIKLCTEANFESLKRDFEAISKLQRPVAGMQLVPTLVYSGCKAGMSPVFEIQLPTTKVASAHSHCERKQKIYGLCMELLADDISKLCEALQQENVVMQDGKRLLRPCNNFRVLIQSLLHAIARLHDNNITHGDLCMHNICLKSQAAGFLIDGECAVDVNGKRYTPVAIDFGGSQLGGIQYVRDHTEFPVPRSFRGRSAHHDVRPSGSNPNQQQHLPVLKFLPMSSALLNCSNEDVPRHILTNGREGFRPSNPTSSAQPALGTRRRGLNADMIKLQRTAQKAKEFQDRTHKDVFALAMIAMNCIISPGQAGITPREFVKRIETACKQSELGNGVDPNWEYAPIHEMVKEFGKVSGQFEGVHTMFQQSNPQDDNNLCNLYDFFRKAIVGERTGRRLAFEMLQHNFLVTAIYSVEEERELVGPGLRVPAELVVLPKHLQNNGRGETTMRKSAVLKFVERTRDVVIDGRKVCRKEVFLGAIAGEEIKQGELVMMYGHRFTRRFTRKKSMFNLNSHLLSVY